MGTPLLPLSYLFGDSRSYLYPGKSKKQLTPAERQLEELYDRIDRPGYRITQAQFFQTPEAMQLLDQLYGSLSDRVPPGSQIVSDTPGKLTYRDADGYEHNIIRKPDGTFSTTTNRPAILPNKQQDTMLETLRQRVQQSLDKPVQFADVPPEVQAQLDAITQARQADINRQIEDERGQLLARLFGNRVNQSSIATDAGARFAEGAGRLRQQEASDAAQRGLGVRQFLTGLGQQQNESIRNLLATLSGQGTQRDIAGAGLSLDQQRLQELIRQFDKSFGLQTTEQQQRQQQIDEYNSPLNQISRLIGIGTQAAGAVGGGLSAYRALTGGR